ncbi:hypothetical protein ACFVWY_24940 [Streptomyces sp. NPDC058195]|uniref:hypothetical protein n=1 Tax=Streptomyces sp. NPDC058195 TaxID=3346375 RepID=UPI0036E1AB3A
MQIADFFQELWSPSFGTPRGSVRDFLAPEAYEDAQRIAEYLRGGHEIFSVMGVSEDVLGTGKTVLGGDSIFSDGEWIWRGDLWFYVWTHHVKLPEEFLTYIREHHYVVPPEDEPRITEIAQYIDARI